MRSLLKKLLPESLYQYLQITAKFYRNTNSYLRYRLLQSKLWVSGIWFTYFTKIYRSNNVSLIVPFHLTDIKFRGRFPLGIYEKEESSSLERFLPDEAAVVELGGCLGYISCLTNKLMKNPENHVVLEANPKLISTIQKNKTLNNCNFKLYNKVISKNSSEIFYFHPLVVGGSTVRKTEKSTEIEGITMDQLSATTGIRFDTLIMDIEGGEYQFLNDFNSVLHDFKTVFIELHPFGNILSVDQAKECEQILLNVGLTKVFAQNNFQVWKRLTEHFD